MTDDRDKVQVALIKHVVAEALLVVGDLIPIMRLTIIFFFLFLVGLNFS